MFRHTTMLIGVLVAGSAASAANYRSQGGDFWRGPAKSPQRSTAHLPQTNGLDNDLSGTQGQLNSLASKLSNIEKSIKTARKRANDVASMIRSLGRVDDKVKRIKRQLDTIVRIPQLRPVKPLANALGSIHRELHSVRKKADRANRDHVQPMIAKLKRAEQKVAAKRKEVRGLASQTQQARGKVNELRGFVASRGNKQREVSTLESLCGSVRPTVGAANRFAAGMNRELGGVDRDFNNLVRKLDGIARAKSAVTKLDRDLAKADKAARNLNKVLSKRVSIKFPKKFSISIRQLLEAPGKVLDIVLKPLMKLAEKALKPVLGKFNIKIKMPRELAALPGQLNGLRSVNLNTPISKIENALRKQAPPQFSSKLNQLMRTSASSLTR